MSDLPASLKPNAADHAATGLNFLADLTSIVAPGTGAFFSLLIGQIIPGQRQDRLADFVTKLSRRLHLADDKAERLEERFEALARDLGAEQRALFEDGALSATRATSPSVSRESHAWWRRASMRERLLLLISGVSCS